MSQYREPIFNIKEPLPLYLGGLFIAVHVAILYGPAFIESFAARWFLLKSLNLPGQGTVDLLTSLIGHGFLHGSWTHVLMNVGMLVVFGVATIQGIKMYATSRGRATSGTKEFMFIFLFAVIMGGLAQWFQWWAGDIRGTALGASGGVSGLFATAAWAMGGQKKMLQFGFAWLVINIVMIFAGELMTGGGGIAWASHLGGYIAGALLAPFMVRPNSTGFSIRS
ncbi:rhomboid family intramembrane serine protease [Fretibacter rubidus]|uniref:rhomboid family intramembrane serine protease n=1 Tax=Fretibacter rubidus TaxID=570162 RepID=UPI00352AE990